MKGYTQPTEKTYFILCEMGGAIKIGLSRYPLDRLKELQLGCPFPLHLIGLMEGGRKEEVYLHTRFSKGHIHGEWFEPTEELVGFIEEHAQPEGG